jgi:glutamate N-acetyltransferase/amino-acid N-acetyltransferase
VGAERNTNIVAEDKKRFFHLFRKSGVFAEMKKDISIPGFLANGIASGIKADGRKDLSLIYSRTPAQVAGVFTTNRFKAAPVILDMERIKSGCVQAIVVNSGNANASTGDAGYEDACAMSRAVSEALQIEEDLVLVASTGVIGEKLPVEKVLANVGSLVEGLSEEGLPSAEEGIMTTDRFPKIELRTITFEGKEITICGIAKGAGMIEPNMATMLSFIMTDAKIEKDCLESVFREGVQRSFNAISVDGCMSTNDTAIIMANGLAKNASIHEKSAGLPIFREALFDVMMSLAKSIVRDGEGATKLIEIVVEGAETASDAKKVAYAVARSNLVKTAFFGEDPNWGRIISAIGSTGIDLSPESVELYFEGIPLFSGGKGVKGNVKRLAEVMKEDTISVLIRLEMGTESFQIYTSDLSYEYIKINSLYTS